MIVAHVRPADLNDVGKIVGGARNTGNLNSTGQDQKIRERRPGSIGFCVAVPFWRWASAGTAVHKLSLRAIER